MSWDFFSFKTVKGAKDHHCAQCGKAIAKGEVHLSAAGKYDGDFNAYREHNECRAAWLEYSKDALRWDDIAPFLIDADCISEDREWFFESHPIVAKRLWPDHVNTAHNKKSQEV